MFSSLSFFKSTSSHSRSPYVFSIEQSELDKKRLEMKNKIEMFQELREDFQHVLINDSLDLFVKGGSVDVIDKQLKHSLLPQFKTKYINILGCIKFIRLKNTTKDYQKVSAELLEEMLKLDGDVIDDLLMLLESNNFSSEINKKAMVDINLSGHLITGKINEGILTEDGDMTAQITMINENAYVIDRIKALFDILLKIETISSSYLPSRFEMIAKESKKNLGAEEKLSEEDDYFFNY